MPLRARVVVLGAPFLLAFGFSACGGFEAAESTPEPSTEAGAPGWEASTTETPDGAPTDAGLTCEIVPLGLPAVLPVADGGALTFEDGKLVAETPMSAGGAAQVEWPEVETQAASVVRLRFWRRIVQEPQVGGEITTGCVLSLGVRDAGRSVVRVVADDRDERLDARWYPPDGGNVRLASADVGSLRKKPVALSIEARFAGGKLSLEGTRAELVDGGPTSGFGTEAVLPAAVDRVLVRCGVLVVRAVGGGSAKVETQDVVLERCTDPR